jgi:IS5 family transposase
MHQTKKGNQWHFGMKANIGADGDSGLVHTVAGTAAVAHVVRTVEPVDGAQQVAGACDMKRIEPWRNAQRRCRNATTRALQQLPSANVTRAGRFPCGHEAKHAGA